MMKMLAILLLLLSSVAFAEASGDVNSSLAQPISSGIYGYSAGNCTQNYGNPPAGCGTYVCFFVAGSTNNGSCLPPSNTACYQNGAWSATGADGASCKNTTHKWSCSSGTWAASECSNGCSSGACSSTTTTTAAGSSSSNSGNNNTVTTTYALSVVSGIDSFNMTQGNTTVKSVTVNNTGKGAVTNVTLSISGVAWATATPSSFASIALKETKTFTIGFAPPSDAQIKTYSVTYTASGAESGASVSGSFTLTLLPTEETVNTVIKPRYDAYLLQLQSLEANITVLKSSGVDVKEIESLLGQIKAKINETASSMESGDYFAASVAMDEADALVQALQEKFTKSPELPVLLIAAAVIIIATIGVVIYMFMPPGAGGKGIVERILERFGGRQSPTFLDKKDNKIKELLDKLRKKKGDKFTYSFGGKE
ncbi:MAG: hypothetical protein HY365_01765 [Candidatus Aenigmarchaeota archaeon]|nr:hypothetical protein [Candidatus Aenigmarchaeota archaeon]